MMLGCVRRTSKVHPERFPNPCSSPPALNICLFTLGSILPLGCKSVVLAVLGGEESAPSLPGGWYPLWLWDGHSTLARKAGRELCAGSCPQATWISLCQPMEVVGPSCSSSLLACEISEETPTDEG